MNNGSHMHESLSFTKNNMFGNIVRSTNILLQKFSKIASAFFMNDTDIILYKQVIYVYIYTS